MNIATVQSTVTEVQAGADTILQLIEGIDPAVALEAGTAQLITDEISKLVQSGLKGLSAATGQAITPDTIAALAPNQTPLSAPEA